MACGRAFVSWAVVSAWAVLGLAGCAGGGKSYEFHPVRGRVLTASGQPFRGGTVVFTLPADPDFVARGTIGEDGSFTLVSYLARPERTADGAPAGQYRVSVDGPPAADATGVSVDLTDLLTVAPGENVFTIRAPAPSSTPRE